MAALCSWLLPTSASAFCRSTTTTPPSGRCINDEDSLLLYWDRPCIDYVFHDQMFERVNTLSETQIRDILETSFDTWHAVDCGRDPFLVSQLTGTTSKAPVEFNFDERNEMVISALTPEEWAVLEQEPMAFAITFIFHDPKTGRIYDVDMALNLGRGPFVDCGNGCRDGSVDLQNTMTHEAGHVFGLGHSDVPRATMQFDAMPGETFMRDLERDDREGLCSIELPGLSCSNQLSCECPPAPIIPRIVRKSVSSCTLGLGEPTSGSAAGVVLVLIALLARVGRRRR